MTRHTRSVACGHKDAADDAGEAEQLSIETIDKRRRLSLDNFMDYSER
jgi:hypothetical protein